MKFGYARVSTLDQNSDSQEDELKKAGCKRIFVDKISGAIINRPELEKLKDQLREGDAVVVWRLDRLGRSISDLIDLMNYFKDKGVKFVSLSESIDTSTSTGRLVFHIFASISEFERNLIVERTKAGLAAARARGRLGGRPKKLTKQKAELLKKLYDEKQMTVQEICEVVGVSKMTFYKYLKDTERENEEA